MLCLYSCADSYAGIKTWSRNSIYIIQLNTSEYKHQDGWYNFERHAASKFFRERWWERCFDLKVKIAKWLCISSKVH